VKEKSFPTMAEFTAGAVGLLEEIQAGLLAKATAFRDAHMVRIDSAEDFRAFFADKAAGASADKAAAASADKTAGGFALVHWAGTGDDENRLREELKVTIRCVPFGDEFAEEGQCFLTGQPSHRRVVFAKSY
jgi:prolyl-tRNA synthetase